MTFADVDALATVWSRRQRLQTSCTWQCSRAHTGSQKQQSNHSLL